VKSRIAFLDTGALYAFVNRNDTDHGKVVAAYRATDRFLAHSAAPPGRQALRRKVTGSPAPWGVSAEP